MRERIGLRLAYREWTCRLHHLPGYPRKVCGRFVTTRPKEMHPTKEATWRLMRRVSEMARHAPVTAVAKMMDLGESTVRRYNIEVLKLDLPAPTLDGTASTNHR